MKCCLKARQAPVSIRSVLNFAIQEYRRGCASEEFFGKTVLSLQG